jgi:hypothetical protein
VATQHLDYWLPISALRLAGTRAVTIDRVLDRPGGPGATTRTSWASTAELHVVADQDGPKLQSAITTGAVTNTSVALAFSEDGRLTSASSDTSGAAVPLVKGMVVAGATVAGFLVAGGPGAALAAGTVRGVTDSIAMLEADLEPAAEGETRPVAPSQQDPVLAAYQADHAQEALLLELSTRQVAEAEVKLAAALEDAISDPTSSKLAAVRRRQEVLRLAREELGRLRRHYDLWRASKVTARSESIEHVVSFDELWVLTPTFLTGRLLWGGETAPARAQQLWDDLGLFPVVTSVDGGATPAPADPPASPFKGVSVRRSRRVQVALYRRTSDADSWDAELVSSQVHDVVDGRSAVVQVPFRSSVWSRRKTAIELSEAGTLASFEHTTTASAQEIGTALGELPASVVSGLEQAGKLREQLDALQDKDREQELARVERDVAIKKEQLELAGLTATEADYAELKRLEQQVSLLEKRRSVATSVATSDVDAGEIARLTQQLELANARRDARTEEELSELKDVLARAEVIAALLAKAKEIHPDPDDED